jgi:anti-sigma factor RsiW
VSGTDEMTCRELVELVTDYFEGTLPEPDLMRFDEHLEECPYCVTYLDQMRQTIRVLGRITEESISAEARDQLLEAFRGWKTAS